jgi:hypothetical protein
LLHGYGQYDSREYHSLGIFVTQTANNFPEFLYTLIFQFEYKILLHNSSVDMDEEMRAEIAATGK